MAIQVFTEDQLHWINKGRMKQDVLKSTIHEALHNNTFNSNFIISSPPGLGKSYEMKQALTPMTNPPVMFEGSASMAAFMVDIATAVYLNGPGPLVVVLDDCDMLFEDKNLNTAKKMFDDTRALKYNKNFRALRGLCTDLQFEALESFARDDKAGLSIPLNNVTFIILTNRHFATVNQVQALEAGSRKEQKYTDLYAIRRRTEGETIEMDDDVLWGYIANVVLNEHICEKFLPTITSDYKNQILQWCRANWSKVTERNLSLVEKMTKDIVRYPKTYLDIWNNRYLEV